MADEGRDKIRCLIRQKEYAATTHERVRQSVLRHLLEDLRYPRECIGVEVYIRLGHENRRLDIAVFLPGRPTTQENIYAIVECKSHEKQKELGQLQSYMSACDNAHFGMLVASEHGRDARVVEVVRLPGRPLEYVDRPRLPAANEPIKDRYTVAIEQVQTPVAAPPAPIVRATLKPARRVRPVAVAAAGMGLVAVIGTVVAFATRRPEEPRYVPPSDPTSARTLGAVVPTTVQPTGAGCRASPLSGFQVRPSNDIRTSGPSYDPPTVVMVLGRGAPHHGSDGQMHRSYLVSTSDGQSGYVFLGPETMGLMGECPPDYQVP